MKNIYQILVCIIIATSVFSCSNEEQESPAKENPSVTENRYSENVLYSGSSVYARAFDTESPMVGYSSLKEHSLAEEQLTPVAPEDEGNMMKSASGRNLRILVNGHDLLQNKAQLKNGQKNINNDLFCEWYGKEVSFVFEKESLKSGNAEKEADTLTMYVPHLVEITMPVVQTEEDLYPYCYYKDLVLGWNADQNNENGLVVMAEWLGTTIDGEKAGVYIRNIDVIPEDDGEAVLNNKLFDNIPDNALAYITLLRGNIELMDIDNMSYRMFGETHAVLPMILVREL